MAGDGYKGMIPIVEEGSGIRSIRMLPPYDNIWIGTHPTDGMTRDTYDMFDVFINVSDSPVFLPEGLPLKHNHWFPINEMGYWGYGSVFAVKKWLDYHHERRDNIYLHCHAGAHRSPMMFLAWLTSCGMTLEDAASFHPRYNESHSTWMVDKFQLDIRQGHLPKHLPEFYRRMRENPTYSLMGILMTGGDIENTVEVITPEVPE